MLNIDLTYSWASFSAHYQVVIGKGLTTLLGGSGEGKSTLLQLIGGFIEGNGRLTFGNDDLQGLPPYERPITTLFQSDNLFPQLTVWQNIAIGLRPSGKLTEPESEAVEWSLDKTQLKEQMHKFPDMLSGGQAQRVALARALVRKRPILLLDEPFSALDPSLREEMLLLVVDLTRDLGLTTLLISHHPHEAKLAGGNIILIQSGEVFEHGDVSLLDGYGTNSALSRYLGKDKLRNE
ncbi:ATP-binding cassette domain-containing protein [Marinomonas sp. 2405UD68-3]|uniref:thiamine ABC transporter ATP-binding protein n=1 Tax=Marinomonas sp. 2405UD68-3 TaxID=3391835 RepID=UPI0039C91CEC